MACDASRSSKSSQRNVPLQKSDAAPYSAPRPKPAPVNIMNPVSTAVALPVIGHGLACENAAISPKGGNSRSKMVQRTNVTASVVASENAETFQVRVMALTSCA